MCLHNEEMFWRKWKQEWEMEGRTRENKGVKRAQEWGRCTKSVLIDLRAEKAISALYAELSGYHGSAGKERIAAKPLSLSCEAVFLDVTFYQKKRFFYQYKT